MKRNELRAMLLEQPYDALVLTSEISRRYATGFHSTAGAVYLSAKQAVFFTDFRYVEAAHAAIKDFEVREIKAGQSYSALINELLDEDGAKKVALEDKTLTYAEFMSWGTALHATAVRLEDGVEQLRMCKEEDEVEKIVAAQMCIRDRWRTLPPSRTALRASQLIPSRSWSRSTTRPRCV